MLGRQLTNAYELSVFTKAQVARWTVSDLKPYRFKKLKRAAESMRGLVMAIGFHTRDIDSGVFERWGNVGTREVFAFIENAAKCLALRYPRKAPDARRPCERYFTEGKSMRLLIATCLLSIGMSSAAAAENRMPDYLQELDRAHHEGDWTLQCNSSRFCQIIGVAEAARDDVGVLAVVMINRGFATEAKPVVRIAFIDYMGSITVPQPIHHLRLTSRGLKKTPKRVKLMLGEPQANGAYRASPEVAARIVDALRRWPDSTIRDRGVKVASMPRGNLKRLMRTMDQLQHPKRPRMTEAQTAEWLKEYHYTVLRSSSVDGLAAPESVLLSCDGRDGLNPPVGARIGPNHVLWTVECPHDTKVFVRKGDEPPFLFNVRDNAKNILPHRYARLDAHSLLQIHLPTKDDALCGQHLKVGFNGKDFQLIEYRRLDRCRAVPHEFWPILWNPTTWKYVEPPWPLDVPRPPAKLNAIFTAPTASELKESFLDK